MRAVAVIPARYGSSRFPGKALAPLLGKPLIAWVIEGTRSSGLIESVTVATDDDRIAVAVRELGFAVMMTSPEHKSGSDRVWEAVADMEADIIVNVQGDEATITGEAIDRCLEPMLDNENIDVATLCTPLADESELMNPNIVKVVKDSRNFALYFSRAPIPHAKSGGIDSSLHFRHIGVYAYRRTALRSFCSLPRSPLERSEGLEQLRGLEAGLRYYVTLTDYLTADVNTPLDIARAEGLLRTRLEGLG